MEKYRIIEHDKELNIYYYWIGHNSYHASQDKAYIFKNYGDAVIAAMEISRRKKELYMNVRFELFIEQI